VCKRVCVTVLYTHLILVYSSRTQNGLIDALELTSCLAVISGMRISEIIECMCVFMCVCVYVCVYVYMCVCVYVCMHVCMYVCTYECMYVYSTV
jgi:hypothetical protein